MCQRVTWQGRRAPENDDQRRHNKQGIPFSSHNIVDEKEVWTKWEGKRLQSEWKRYHRKGGDWLYQLVGDGELSVGPLEQQEGICNKN